MKMRIVECWAVNIMQMCLLLAVASLSYSPNSNAQIATDGTLGAGGAQTLTGPNYSIGEALGTKSSNGANLFHSFSTFNVRTIGVPVPETATFTATPAVANIIARVTGGASSTIDGAINVQAGPTTGLWIMNPSGILVGENASFNMSQSMGTVALGAADSVKFSNGDQFALSTTSSGLSIAAPESFGFLQNSPAGKLTLTDFTLTERDNLVVSVATNPSLGDVILAANDDVTLTGTGTDGTTIQTFGYSDANGANRAGRIDIRSNMGDIILEKNSKLLSGNSTNATGDVSINGISLDAAAGKVEIKTGGQIRIDARQGSTNAGVQLKASDVLLSGNGGTTIGVSTLNDGIGNDIIITATNDVTIGDAQSISTGRDIVNQTNSTGAGGDIQITARNINLSNNAGLVVETTDASLPGNGGIGGSVELTATDRVLLNDAQILSDSDSFGNAGDIKVTAGRIHINDGSSIRASNRGDGSSGLLQLNAGSEFFINYDQLGIPLWNPAQVTISSGRFVNLDGSILSADGIPRSIEIAGENVFLNTALIDSTTANNTLHDPANITISALTKLTLHNTEISASTSGSSDAGNINISVKSTANDDTDRIQFLGLYDTSKISASSVNPPPDIDGNVFLATGNAGSINIFAEELYSEGEIVTNTSSLGSGGDILLMVGSTDMQGGLISASTQGTVQHPETGNAGNITIIGEYLRIDGRGCFFPCLDGLRTQSGGSDPDTQSTLVDSPGAAGKINLTLDRLVLSNDGVISVSTISGPPGSIEITAKDSVLIENSSVIAFSELNSPGSIHIKTQVLALNNGSIDTSSPFGVKENVIDPMETAQIRIDVDELYMLGSLYLTEIFEDEVQGYSQIISSSGGEIDSGKITISGVGTADDNKDLTKIVDIDEWSSISTSASINFNYVDPEPNGATSSASAGAINVFAKELNLDGVINSSYSENFKDPNRLTGNAGFINLEVGIIKLNGEITTSSTDGGNAGTITVTGNTLVGTGTDGSSRISSAAKGTGRGGSISITQDELTLSGTEISVESIDGIAGNITLDVNALTIDQNAKILATSENSNAGSILISGKGTANDATDLAQLVSVGAGSSISTSATGLSSSGAAGFIDAYVDQLNLGGVIESTTAGSGTAGTITVTGNTLTGTGGSISSAATGSGKSGNISISEDALTLSGTEISVKSIDDKAGNIDIDVNTLDMKGNATISAESTNSAAGFIVITAQDSIHLDNHSDITSSTGAPSSSFDPFDPDFAFIALNTAELKMLNRSSIKAETTGGVNSGFIAISGAGESYYDDSAQLVYVGSGSAISTAAKGSSSSGAAGDIQLYAEQLDLDGGTIASSSQGSGGGGYIYFEGNTLEMRNGALLSATAEQFEGGEITIYAEDSIHLDNSSILASTNAQSFSVNGDAGSFIGLNTPELMVLNGSTIAAETTGALGTGLLTVSGPGRIDAFADLENFDPTDHDPTDRAQLVYVGTGSTISTSAIGDTSTGNAGNIDLFAEQLTLEGGTIASSSQGFGSAGSITLDVYALEMDNAASISVTSEQSAAGSILISARDGIDLDSSSITATTNATTSSAEVNALASGDGNVAAIRLNTPKFTLSNGAKITAETTGALNSGSITISGVGDTDDATDRAQIVNVGAGSTISTSATGRSSTGNAGNIDLYAEQLDLNDGSITSFSEGSGSAGSITLDVYALEMYKALITVKSDNSTGGSIFITARDLVQLTDSQILAEANGTDARDNGGNITINGPPDYLILNRSRISANGNGGPGGNITINADNLVKSADSLITASSREDVSGQIILDVTNSLTQNVIEVDVPDLALPEPLDRRCTPAQVQNRSSLRIDLVAPYSVESAYLDDERNTDGQQPLVLAMTGCSS